MTSLCPLTSVMVMLSVQQPDISYTLLPYPSLTHPFMLDFAFQLLGAISISIRSPVLALWANTGPEFSKYMPPIMTLCRLKHGFDIWMSSPNLSRRKSQVPSCWKERQPVPPPNLNDCATLLPKLMEYPFP